MQVINSDGYILGKVKEVALVLGEADQAITVESSQGKLNYIRWSDVAVAGDVILLKTGGMPETDVPAATQSFAPPAPTVVQPVAQPVAMPVAMPVVIPVAQPVAQPMTQPVIQPVVQANVCPKCGAELESGCVFCTSCGYRVKA
jgi:sporulation protein YlmC with PRC-barrel domain/ribosomal protein L40E